MVRTNGDRIPNNQRISCDLKSPSRANGGGIAGSNGDHQVDDIDGDRNHQQPRRRGSPASAGARPPDISRSDLIRATDIKGRRSAPRQRRRTGEYAGQVTINGAFSARSILRTSPLQFDGTRAAPS